LRGLSPRRRYRVSLAEVYQPGETCLMAASGLGL
jgi:hypothetical protein